MRLLIALFTALPLMAQTPEITRGDFRKTLTLAGELASISPEKFYVPRVDSWQIQLEWMIPEGERVEPGQAVVRFDNNSVLDQLTQTLSQLAQKREERVQSQSKSEADILEQDLKIKTAENAHDKAKIKAGVPAELQDQRTYQQAQLDLERTEKSLAKERDKRTTMLANQKTQLDIFDLEIDELIKTATRQDRLSKALELVAQTSGIAIYEDHPWEGRKLNIGDTVQSTWSVLRIPNPDGIIIEAYVGESDLALVQVDQIVTMNLDAYPDRQFQGRIQAIAKNAVTKQTFGKAPYFKVTITPDQIDEAIMRPGMSVRAEILVQQVQNVLLIPLQLATPSDDGFLVQRQGAEPVTVQALGLNDFHLAVRHAPALEPRTAEEQP